MDWWPRDLQNKPLGFIHRAIRNDFEEWLDDHPCHDARRCENKKELVWHVVDAVAHDTINKKEMVWHVVGAVAHDTIIDVATKQRWMADHDHEKQMEDVMKELHKRSRNPKLNKRTRRNTQLKLPIVRNMNNP